MIIILNNQVIRPMIKKLNYLIIEKSGYDYLIKTKLYKNKLSKRMILIYKKQK